MSRQLSTCEDCTTIDNDDRPGDYFVSVADAGRIGLVSGPYKTHADAKANVQRVSSEAAQFDPRSPFYGWGTARLEPGSGVRGVLEKRQIADALLRRATGE